MNKIPFPGVLRAEVFADEGLYRRYGNLVTAYDPEQQTGGLLDLRIGRWTILTPISDSEFAELAARAAAEVNRPIDSHHLRAVN
jgi:hypothetical protein